MQKTDGRIHRLQDKIRIKKEQIQKYCAQKEFFSTEIVKIQADLKQLENDLKQLATRCSVLAVSDHALVRWLERVKGIDMNLFRSELIKTLPPYLPDGEHVLGGDKYIVKDNTVITIMSKNENPLHQK